MCVRNYKGLGEKSEYVKKNLSMSFLILYGSVLYIYETFVDVNFTVIVNYLKGGGINELINLKYLT